MDFRRLIAADDMEGPRAWIQWKGTNVCMDVHCACGAHGHIDDSFAYFYLCWNCGKLWGVGQNVRLHELTTEEDSDVRKTSNCIVTSHDNESMDG